MCEPLGYASISMPNPKGHQNQTEVNEELEDFEQLVSSGCSLYLRHFLCAYYAPFCRAYLPIDLAILPCKELCLHVKKRCESLIISSSNYTWPEHLQCDLFPSKSQAPWCFGPDSSLQIQEDSTIFTTDHLMSTMSITPSSTSTNTNIETATTSPSPSCAAWPSDSICSSLDYSQATHHNRIGHSTKEETEYNLQTTFDIFVSSYECSPHLVMLLCYYYHPQCNSSTGTLLYPCRELCMLVTEKCQSAVQKWPDNFNCTQLPSKNSSNAVCIMVDDNVTSHPVPSVVGVEKGGATRNIATSITIIIITVMSLAVVCV